MQRQYNGTAGRTENSQVGVFPAYVWGKGRTLLDWELYLPQMWADDRERRREAGAPESVGFQTKGPHYDPDEKLIPVTVPEVRRVMTRLEWTEHKLPDFILS